MIAAVTVTPAAKGQEQANGGKGDTGASKPVAEPAPGAGRSTGCREGAGALVREGRETGVEHRASPGGGWNLQSAAPVHAGSLDPFSPAGQPAAVQADQSAGARRFRRAKCVMPGSFPVSDGPLITDADVASFMAPLHKWRRCARSRWKA